jgi:hypothetical protein
MTNLVSESPEFAEKPTPLFAGSAITRWDKSISPLDKECPTFRGIGTAKITPEKRRRDEEYARE